jgi:cytochrome c-type biogenesis protein CcmH/NrfF
MFIRAAALLAMAAWAGGAQEVPEDFNTRRELLERSLLAPCCYKEPIARHHSDIATKMRMEVARWVEEGKSNEEILGAYRERYGDKVVVPPEPDPSPWIRTVPWLLAIGGGVLVIRILARWRARGIYAREAPVSQ